MRVLLLLLLVAPLAAAGPAPHVVHILGAGTAAAFTPVVLVIQAGESVVWSNDDLLAVPHIAVGRNIDTGFLQGGEVSAPARFDEPGYYFYHCPLHATMREGQIWVV
jgi:plastocyanin